ncbi:MAG: GNAT family N-acetyltransferase, partial [Clostridiales bacterium]|nr:GNAT family N-acetyltransferase [Clostridiales bacterium]
GIGTELLCAIEQECTAARYELFTSSKSIKNIRLYERLGYVKFRDEIENNIMFVYLEKYSNAK